MYKLVAKSSDGMAIIKKTVGRYQTKTNHGKIMKCETSFYKYVHTGVFVSLNTYLKCIKSI